MVEGSVSGGAIDFPKTEDISLKVKSDLKKYTASDSDKSHWQKIRIGRLILIFKYWLKLKEAQQPMDWVMKKEYFFEDSEEDEWQVYLKGIEGYSGIDVSEDRTFFEITGSRRIKYERVFYELLGAMKYDVTSRVEETNTKTDDVKGFILKNDKYKPTSELLQSSHFHTMINKHPISLPFDLMDNLERTKLSSVPEKIMRIKAKIIKQIKLSEQMRFYGSYNYVCPSCSVVMNFLSYQMGKQTIKHSKCPSNGGNDMIIARASFEYANFWDLYCYEVLVYDEDDNFSSESQHFFSFDPDLENGLFIMDVVNLRGKITKPDDKVMKTIILGAERMTPKLIPNLFNEKDGKALAKFYKVKYHKIFDILSGVIKFYESRGVHLKPEKGGLIQLMLITSAIMKTVFGYDKGAISVIGDTSLSKTYPARLICPLFDYNFEYLSRGESASVVGLQGGVDVNFYINGQKMTMFQEGLMSSGGMTVFDEAQDWYLKSEINNLLKSYFDDTIKIAKMGGKTIPQKYTPILLSNFSKFHNNMDVREKSYISEIRNFYFKMIIKVDDDDIDLPHKKVRMDSDNYVLGQNLYLPLQYYDNVYLQEAIGIIRKNYFRNNISWMTGGDIAAMNRVVFDVICKKDDDDNFETSFEKVVDSEAQNQMNLPTSDFILTCHNYLLGNRKINIKTGAGNTDEVNTQIELLYKSIENYMESEEGELLLTHFRDGNKKVDEKLAGLIIKVCMVWQMTNDGEATELDSSTKELMNNILLKNKRGLTEAEYNFMEHSYIPDKEVIENKIFKNTVKYIDSINSEYEEKLKKTLTAEIKAEAKAEVISEIQRGDYDSKVNFVDNDGKWKMIVNDEPPEKLGIEFIDEDEEDDY